MIWLLALMACDSEKRDGDFDSGETVYESPYIGGWPFNPDKDDLGEPDWSSPPGEGAQIPHFVAQDQHGDWVDLYDFAGHGVPIVVDFTTLYCSPCKALAAYLSDGDMSHLCWKQNEETGADEYYPWWKEEYAGLRDLVANGELYWVTVLMQASEESPLVTQADCVTWETDYPNEHIAVLADTESQLKTWLGFGFTVPTINVANDDMTLLAYSDGGPYEAMRYFGELLAAQ
jgi:thiol-disulfide isomerase/thioredoxin